jgi:hypothetical protein
MQHILVDSRQFIGQQMIEQLVDLFVSSHSSSAGLAQKLVDLGWTPNDEFNIA